MENVVIIYGHLEHLAAICYTFGPFGIFSGHLGIFFLSLVHCVKENLAALLEIEHVEPEAALWNVVNHF
jgi:hypothetical protein